MKTDKETKIETGMKNKDFKKRELTEEESIILDCWYQFATRTKKGMWSGGIGSLRDCGDYLTKHKIINAWGNPKKNIIW